MGYFNLDFNKYKPSSLGGTKLATPSATPVSVQKQPLAIPKLDLGGGNQSAPSAQVTPQYKPEPNKSLVQKGFEALSIPSQKTEQFLTGGKGYETQLKTNPTARKFVAHVLSGTNYAATPYIEKTLEKSDTARSLTGGAGRMLLDPLNLLAFMKPIQILSKIPLLNKVGKVGQVIEKIPGVSKVKNLIGEKFVQGYGKPAVYNDLFRNVPRQIGVKGEEVVQRVKDSLKLNPNKKAKEAASLFLEPNNKILPGGKIQKGIGATTDLGALRSKLGSQFDKIRPFMKEARQMGKQQIYDLVKQGKMTGEQAKVYLKGGYLYHTGEAQQALRSKGGMFGIGRGYLKSRTGGKVSFNAPQVVVKREMKQSIDNIMEEFFTKVKSDFGAKVVKGDKVPVGYVKLKSVPQRLKMLKGAVLPKNIADDLTMEFGETGKLGKIIDTFNQWWKPTATSVNPGFHVMNQMGNMYNSWLAGMKDPRRFIQSATGLFSKGEKEIVRKSGVASRGQFGADMVAKVFENPKNISSDKAFGWARHAGEAIENNARSALYLDRRQSYINKGLSEIEAGKKALKDVDKFLFDYVTGLTPFERQTMKRAFPFYTWARKNIPVQAESVVKQPYKPAAVSKIFTQSTPTGQIEGDQPGFSVPLPFKDKSGNPVRWRPNLPIQDLFNLGLDRAGSMLHPLLKEGYELGKYALTGGKIAPVDWFTGKDRTDVRLRSKARQIKEIVGSEASSMLRPVRTVQKVQEQGSDPLAWARQLILTGTYTLPEQSMQLRSINKDRGNSEAINSRISKIYNDLNAGKITKDEALKQIDSLEKEL